MAIKVKWPLELIKAGLQRFYTEHDRYPTATEVDSYQYLPRAKTIERRFGGLVALRKQLNLKGQQDFRTGAHSSARARSIGARAHVVEREVYDLLCRRFGKEYVHREFFFFDDKRTRADFFVYDAGKGFCVDVFYPRDRHNLVGCLNSKQRKYSEECMRQYPIIFLQMNSELSQGILDDYLGKKTVALPKGQQLMGWHSFNVFIRSREARH